MPETPDNDELWIRPATSPIACCEIRPRTPPAELSIFTPCVSTLATILLNKQVALAEGALALLLLIALQFCITWIASGSGGWNGWSKMSRHY